MSIEHLGIEVGVVGCQALLTPAGYVPWGGVWWTWQLQGRVCKLCSHAILFDLMRGAHIVPWSLGWTDHDSLSQGGASTVHVLNYWATNS